MVGQMLARSVLNGMPLGLNVAEYIYKFIVGEPRTVMLDLERTDKNLFNNINDLDPEVLLQFFLRDSGSVRLILLLPSCFEGNPKIISCKVVIV